MQKKSSKKSKLSKKNNPKRGFSWDTFRQKKLVLPAIVVAIVGILGVSTLVASNALTSIGAPQSLTATPVSSSRIDLKWWPSSPTAVNAYRIFRDEVQVGSVTVYLTFDGSVSYQDTGLSPATQYNYRVEAYQDDLVASTPTITASTFAATPASQLGTVSGIVIANKKPVSGATVSIYYERQNHTATTGSDGKFSISNVPEGRYTLSTQASGYKSSSNKITVKGSATTTITVSLRQSR